MDESLPNMVPIQEISHHNYTRRGNDMEHDPSENSTLEGSAFSQSMSGTTRSNAAGGDTNNTRDFSRHSSMMSSVATTISSLSDDYYHRTNTTSSRGGRRPLPSGSTDDAVDAHDAASRQQQYMMTAADQPRRTPRRTRQRSLRRRLSSQQQQATSIREDEDEHDTTYTHPASSLLGDDSGMTHIDPPSPTPQRKRTTAGSNDDDDMDSESHQRTEAATAAKVEEEEQEQDESHHIMNNNNNNSGHQSVASASALNMVKKKIRRKRSVQQPKRISAYEQLQLHRQHQLELQQQQQQQQQQLEQTIPNIIVPASGTRLSSSTNNNNNNSSRRRRLEDDNYSLANSTIATRDTYDYDTSGGNHTNDYAEVPYDHKEEDDDETVMTPIPPSSEASWKKVMSQKLPNKLPQRKTSMSLNTHMSPGRLSVTEGCSVVTEGDDDDDDDETVLSPLQVTGPKEKIHEALHFHNLNLPLPMSMSHDDDDDEESIDIRSGKFQTQRKGGPPRNLVLQKAKSVSHLIGLEQQLQALPSNDDEDDDIVVVPPPQLEYGYDYETSANNSNKQPSITDDYIIYSSSNNQHHRSAARRMSALSRSTRSLSPVRNRWITGCRDGLMVEMEDDAAEQQHDDSFNYNYNNNSNVTALASNLNNWHLADPAAVETNATTLVFQRASSSQQQQQPLQQDYPTPVKGLGAAPRYSRDNASLASSSYQETTSLAKSHSTPNLNAMDDSTTNCDNNNSNDNDGAQQQQAGKLPAEKFEGLLDFLLGNGLPHPPESSSSPSTNSPKTKTVQEQANMESTKDTTTVEADEGCESATDKAVKEEKTPMMEEKSINNSSLEEPQKPIILKEIRVEPQDDSLEEQKKPITPKEIRVEPRDNDYLQEIGLPQPREENQKVPQQVNHKDAADTTKEKQHKSQEDPSKLSATDAATKKNQQQPAMPKIVDFESYDDDKAEEESQSFIKKIKKRVKNVGQASTRYLRKKKNHSLINSAKKDEMVRLSQSMSSIVFTEETASLSESGWHSRMEKLEELPSSEDAPEAHATSTDAKPEGKAPAEAASSSSKQKQNQGRSFSPRNRQMKQFSFNRASSVPDLLLEDEDDQGVLHDVGAIVNENQSTISENLSAVCSAAGGDVVWERQKKSVAERRRSRSIKQQLPSSFRNDGPNHSATNSSASPKTPTKANRLRQHPPKRSSTVNEKQRNRSRSGSHHKSMQRSKSASSRPRNKEKTRGSGKKNRTRFSVADESLRSLFDNESTLDSSSRHHKESTESTVREARPRMSFRRHASLRNVDDASHRSVSTRKSLASTATKPSDRRLGMKSKSSRDLYQRKSKARTVDETTESAPSSSRRSSKMKLARQAKSERFLNSSAKSARFLNGSASSMDEADTPPSSRTKPATSSSSSRGNKMKLARRAKSERFLNSSASSMEEAETTPSSRAKPIRRLGPRAKSGSYGALGNNSPTALNSSKKQSSSRRLHIDKDNEATEDSDQGLPHSNSGLRKATASGTRGNRPVRHKKMGKSQSLRHVMGGAV